MSLIHQKFNNLVGQERAKTLLSASVESAKRGGMTASPLITAPAGVGKSVMVRAYISALSEETGRKSLLLNSPEELRAAGGQWDEFQTMVTGGEPYVLGIDEIHLVDQTPTRQLRILKSYLLKALDKNNDGKSINLTNEFFTTFDRTQHTIVIATNFPEKLDSSGALQSRCDLINLDLYNEEELIEIEKRLLFEIDLDVDDDAIAIIARCGRGTVRPIRNILDQIKIVFDEKTVTKDMVKEVLKMLKIYPRGLNEYEINLLMVASQSAIKDSQFLAMNPGCSVSALRYAKGYLTNPQNGLLVQMANNSMETTRKGKTFLKALMNDGFID